MINYMKKKVIIGIVLLIVLGVVLFFALKPSKITIDFDSDGGSNVSSMEILKGDKIKLPIIEKEGYDFLGWFINDGKIDDNYIYNKDVILQAKWEFVVTYKVSFESNGGSNVENIVVREGEKLTLPENPSREDYNFLGWKYENGEFIEDNIIIDKDIVLYAEWEYKYYCDSGYTLKDKKCTKRLEAIARMTSNCPPGHLDLGKGTCFGNYKKVSLNELICPQGSNPIPDEKGRCYNSEVDLSLEDGIETYWYLYDGKYYRNYTYAECENNVSASWIGTASGSGFYCGGNFVSGNVSFYCQDGYSLVGEMCYKNIVEDAKIK